MKKLLIPAALLLVAACNSSQPTPVETAAAHIDSVKKINSPFPVTYSSQFEIADPKYAETILTLWKDFDAGDLNTHKDLFADSVSLYLTDGASLLGRRDSIISWTQKYRGAYKSVVDRVDAVTALRSTDKNENWALVWGMETSTDMKGKVDSTNLMETWRFNKDGKVDLLYQYRMDFPKLKKK